VAFYERNGFNITDYYYHEGTEVYQVMATDASLNIQVVEKLTKKAVIGLIAISFEKKAE
ncbi:GNAT family N-acetyltransferase, partial [Enterococcus faecalis]